MSLQSVAVASGGWPRLQHWSNPLNYLCVQVCLSCCTLKCKITISEIENGWLSTVATDGATGAGVGMEAAAARAGSAGADQANGGCAGERRCQGLVPAFTW